MEERESRYYLIHDHLYEMAVNFDAMQVNIYLLDQKLSTEDAAVTNSIVMNNSLTANSFVGTKNPLEEYHKVKIIYNCRSMTRQILNFKYKEDRKATISYFETYKEAYKKWKESLETEELENNKIRECTLENIILSDDTKEDILSTINFVKRIEKYKEMGCVVPAGILLEGPPGTGKSLCAKTIAQEGNMNFKSIVASDLVQKYVGESAKRIEKEFNDLIKAGGGIMFIDEIDAIGIQRSSSDENKEYRAALNKLLACMSEASDNNVIVICATNMKDQLDPALIREGRIDKVIKVPLPDYESRVKLFELYVNKLKHEDDVDYSQLADKTDGRSGAFIAACCNHAGIYAVDQGADKTSMEHIMHTLNKMLNNRDDIDQTNNQHNPIGFI